MAATTLAYEQYDWGDWLKGTKEQLQSLGIGIGLAYPGEPGGPRYKLKASDPRGFSATVEMSRGDGNGQFTVRLKFPGWPETPIETISWAPSQHAGVEYQEGNWFDVWRGSAAALVAAGLVKEGYFPGMAGMRKTRVTVYADGSLPTGAPTANDGRRRGEVGSRTVERLASDKYTVTVTVSEKEGCRRQEDRERATANWQRQVRSLPRPARLVPGAPAAAGGASARLPPHVRRPATTPFEPLICPPNGRASKAFEQHVFNCLREVVDYSQESIYNTLSDTSV